MRKVQARKIRQLYNRELAGKATELAKEQGNYLRLSLKPFPKRGWAFRLWLIGARFYFTADHIENIKASYARLQNSKS